MKAIVDPVDKLFEPLFTGLPKLPHNGRDALVKAMPWIAGIFGVLQVLAFIGLVQLAFWADRFADYANQFSAYSQTAPVGTFSLFLWLSIFVLLIDAVILLMAVSPLNKRQKKGWDLLYLGVLINLVYGVIAAFDFYYGGAGRLFGAIISSSIGFYLLYQIKSQYHAAHHKKESE